VRDEGSYGDSEAGGQEHGEELPVKSPVKTSHPANDNLKGDLTRRTREIWRPRLSRDLSSEDARQIAVNVTGFFAVLAAWSRAEMPSPANDAGKPGTSESEVRHDR
jgi:hypothetical protein